MCSIKNMAVIDKKTKKLGIIFRIKRISLNSPEIAKAEGEYYEDGLSASENTYYLRKKGDEWIIEKDILNTIASLLKNIFI